MNTKMVAGKIITYFFLGILFITVAYPLVWPIISSFRPTWAIFQNPVGLPRHPILTNYVEVWVGGNFGRYFLNSTVITGCSLIGALFLSIIAGYGFARYQFRGSKTIFFIFILGLMVSSTSIMLPQYRLITILGLLSTHLGIILVYLSWVTFGIILFRQAFKETPQELVDAALIDGCGEFGICFRILVPIIRPTIATVAIFESIWIWNDFIWPLILLQKSTQQTVILGIMALRGPYLADWGAITAGLCISVIPVLVLYFIFQRHFVRGLTMGAVKG